MPKQSEFPRLRVSVKRGKKGQVWSSWWYDMRGTGQPDIALGTDHAAALVKWAEITAGGPRTKGTLEEAFAGWEQRGIECKPNGQPRKPETIAGYLKCLRAIRKPFGAARWEDITLPVLAQYIRKRSAKGRAKQEMQLLSVIWAWARLEGMTALQWPAVGMQASGWKGATGTRQVQVSDDQFAAIYKHADQTLRDYLDIATATGLRGHDVCGLTLGNVREGMLIVDAGKTGKRAEFDLAGSILGPLIERRRAMRGPQHLFLLAAGRKPVTYRAVTERFSAARAKAAESLPSCAGVWLRDMRKRAAALSDDLAGASKLLQHSSLSVTRQHYRQGDKLKPVR